MTKTYPEHISRRPHPKNFANQDLELFKHEFFKKIHAATIEIVTDVDILTDTLFDRSKLKFYTTHTHLAPLTVKQRLRKLKLYLDESEEIDKGIWIVNNWSLGYFHWLTESIPRLLISESLINNHIVLLPIEFANVKFIRQSLEMLNYNVEFFKFNRRMHVKELILPSHTGPTGNYNKKIINLVKDKFLSKSNRAPARKIYVSRQKASKRKIINEVELISLLKDYDFEIHFFEEYDFHQQVSLMQEATHLIGLHGAGLTNMLFMPNNSKILELRNVDDAHNNCYFSLASDLEHDYYYLLNNGDSPDTHIVNITVNLQRLKEVVEEMG